MARSQPPDERVEKNIDTLSRIRGLCQYLKKTAIRGFKRGFSFFRRTFAEYRIVK